MCLHKSSRPLHKPNVLKKANIKTFCAWLKLCHQYAIAMLLRKTMLTFAWLKSQWPWKKSELENHASSENNCKTFQNALRILKFYTGPYSELPLAAHGLWVADMPERHLQLTLTLVSPQYPCFSTFTSTHNGLDATWITKLHFSIALS